MPHILTGIFLCTGFGILLYLGLMGSSVPVYSVSELLKIKPNNVGSELEAPKVSEENELIQLYGNVAKLVKQENLNILLQDQEIETNSVKVSYNGIIPNNLKLGQAIFLTGKYDYASKEFLAYEIVTTCPSKYQDKSQAGHQVKDQAPGQVSVQIPDQTPDHVTGYAQDLVRKPGQNYAQDNSVNLFITPSINRAESQTKAE